MILSVALVVLAFPGAQGASTGPVRLDRSDVVFYSAFALAVATFMTAWIGGWMYDGVLGDKRRSLRFIFLLFFGVFLFFGLGPVVAASALGKGDGWVNAWRTNPILAVSLWQALKAVRETRKRAGD